MSAGANRGEMMRGIEAISRIQRDVAKCDYVRFFLSRIVEGMNELEIGLGHEYHTKQAISGKMDYSAEFLGTAEKVMGVSYFWGDTQRGKVARIASFRSEEIELEVMKPHYFGGACTWYARKLVIPTTLLVDLLIEKGIPSLLEPSEDPLARTAYFGRSEVLKTFVQSRYEAIAAILEQRKKDVAEAVAQSFVSVELGERRTLEMLMAKYPDMIPGKKARKRLFGKKD